MCLYAFRWLQSKLNALLDTTNPQKESSTVAGTALHRAYTSLLHSEANRWDKRRQSRSKFLSHTWLIATQGLEGCCKLRKSPVSSQLEAHPSRTRGGPLLPSFHSSRQREQSWRDAATYRSHHHKDNPVSWKKRPTRLKPPYAGQAAQKQSPCLSYKASQHTLGRMAAQSRDRTYRNFSKYIIKQAACVWGGCLFPTDIHGTLFTAVEEDLIVISTWKKQQVYLKVPLLGNAGQPRAPACWRCPSNRRWLQGAVVVGQIFGHVLPSKMKKTPISGNWYASKSCFNRWH